MNPVTVSSKGWVVIPAELRRKYQIQPGSKINIVDFGGVLSLVPNASDPIQASHGSLKGGPSLTQTLLEDRARERKRES
jgi:AbrB family looped-hinge helix DNA binding protein